MRRVSFPAICLNANYRAYFTFKEPVSGTGTVMFGHAIDVLAELVNGGW